MSSELVRMEKRTKMISFVTSTTKYICISFVMRLLWFVAVCLSVTTGTFSNTNWQSSVSIKEYNYYGNVRLLEYHIPDNSYESSWYFTAHHVPDSCEDRTIVVYLQHGSYPVISPLNETFPDNFNLERTNLHMIQASSNSTPVVHQLLTPLPDSWFAAAILGDYVDDKISVKGIGDDCNYYLACTHNVMVLDGVDSLAIGSAVSLTILPDTPLLYRFHTYEHTWQYQLGVENCTKESLDDISSCPLVLLSRAFALPNANNEETHVTNCSTLTDNYCISTVTSPATNSWIYIKIEAIGDAKLELVLAVQTKECTSYSTVLEDKSHINDNRPTVSFSYVTVDDFSGKTILGYDSAETNQSALQSELISLISENEIELVKTLSSDTWQHETDHNITMNAQINLHFEQSGNNTVANCIQMPELGRHTIPNRAFHVNYNQNPNAAYISNSVVLTEENPVVVKFDVRSMFDIGGTLKIHAWLDEVFENTSQEVQLHTCIQQHSIPIDDSMIVCEPQRLLTSNLSEKSRAASHLYFPYPEPGSWYMAMLMKCYSTQTLLEETCESEYSIAKFAIDLRPCVDGSCGEHGSCRHFYSGVLHFSVCKCTGNWQGYGCTDDTVAIPDWEQLLAVLLLTLSNLFMLPAVLLATYRRFFIEALVYFFTMFFSTFYHACDGEYKYTYCIMPFDVLSFCDFWGAILSFWVTIITMAKLVSRLQTFLFMLGTLGIGMGVTWDKFNVWTFLVPIIVALTIMIGSWSSQCYKTRGCFPSIKRYTFCIIPGLVIAGAGLIVYTFFETESNYHYTHSFWHASIQLSIVFFLPPRQHEKSVSDDKDMENTQMSSMDHGVTTINYIGDMDISDMTYGNDASEKSDYVVYRF